MTQKLLDSYNELKKKIQVTYNEGDPSHGTLTYDPVYNLIKEAYNTGLIEGTGRKDKSVVELNLGLSYILDKDYQRNKFIKVNGMPNTDVKVVAHSIVVVDNSPSFWYKVRLSFRFFKMFTEYSNNHDTTSAKTNTMV